MNTVPVARADWWQELQLPSMRNYRLAIAPVWAGFALAAATGLLLFSTQAQALVENGAFLAKAGLVGLAGANALGFETLWRRRRAPTRALKPSAALSPGLWIAVIVFSSWIPFWQFS